MIDLEAIEAQRPTAPEPAEADDDDERTPPPHADLEEDTDATGTLGISKMRRRARGEKSIVADDPRAAPGDDVESTQDSRSMRSRASISQHSKVSQMSGVERSRTGLSRVDASRGDDDNEGTRGTRGTQHLARSARAPLQPKQAAVLAIAALVLVIAGLFAFSRYSAVLTVTTVPTGATVTLDGDVLGRSPLQKRVRVGVHGVELALDGYESWRDVVDVPAAGLPFLQPLKALPPPLPPAPTPAQLAAELVDAIGRLLDASDADTARAKLEQLEGIDPHNAAIAGLRARLDVLQAKLDEEQRKLDAQNAHDSRISQARVAFAEADRLYTKGQLGKAKETLYRAIQLDGKYAEPHRLLGRIFNREGDVEKVRYHLQRFLQLGGADSDFKVREWLQSHPE